MVFIGLELDPKKVTCVNKANTETLANFLVGIFCPKRPNAH